MHAEITKHVRLGRQKPQLPCGSTRRGRNDLGGEQTRRSERKEMSAASKKRSAEIGFAGRSGEADPHPCWGRPMTWRKNRYRHSVGPAVVRDQTSEEGFAEITSGRSCWQR